MHYVDRQRSLQISEQNANRNSPRNRNRTPSNNRATVHAWLRGRAGRTSTEVLRAEVYRDNNTNHPLGLRCESLKHVEEGKKKFQFPGRSVAGRLNGESERAVLSREGRGRARARTSSSTTIFSSGASQLPYTSQPPIRNVRETLIRRTTPDILCTRISGARPEHP